MAAAAEQVGRWVWPTAALEPLKTGTDGLTLNLKQLETFQWVATLGSFRKAAERLHTTQPAVSSRISNLEDALGVGLFERHPGSIALTAKGLELLPHAKKILRMAETVKTRMGDGANLSGILRLGVSETIVHTWLPSFLTRLHDALPRVDVEITVDVTVNLRNELVARSLDLALLMGPVSEFSMVNFDLSRFPLAWAASPRLGIEPSQRLPLDKLIQFPILTYARNTSPCMELTNYTRENCEDSARIFPSSSLAACLRMTIDGIGIGTLPRQVVSEHLKSGSLMEVDCEWRPSDLLFTATFAADPFNPITEKAAFLAQEVASEGQERKTS